eukprot:PhF_6_TR14155/c0_g1_i1/m.22642
MMRSSLNAAPTKTSKRRNSFLQIAFVFICFVIVVRTFTGGVAPEELETRHPRPTLAPIVTDEPSSPEPTDPPTWLTLNGVRTLIKSYPTCLSVKVENMNEYNTKNTFTVSFNWKGKTTSARIQRFGNHCGYKIVHDFVLFDKKTHRVIPLSFGKTKKRCTHYTDLRMMFPSVSDARGPSAIIADLATPRARRQFGLPNNTIESKYSNDDYTVRCDQGRYMGLTNILQAMTVCVGVARICQRRVVEFPTQLQHETFHSIFDIPNMVSQVKAIYGIELRFVPGPIETKIDLKPDVNTGSADNFRMYCAVRRGRLELGDMWKTLLTPRMEAVQKKFFAQGLFRPIGKVKQLVEDVLAGLTQNNTVTNWGAVHLRFEADRWGMEKNKRNNEQDALNVVQHLLTTFQHHKKVYYAAGGLPPTIQRHIPNTWASKSKWIDVGAVNTSFVGKWFNGRPITITNATGALVDFYVIIAAPKAVVAEFSSFGENIALVRCAHNRPTTFYDISGKVWYEADCKKPILFQRAFKEGVRGCMEDSVCIANEKKGESSHIRAMQDVERSLEQPWCDQEYDPMKYVHTITNNLAKDRKQQRIDKNTTKN